MRRRTFLGRMALLAGGTFAGPLRAAAGHETVLAGTVSRSGRFAPFGEPVFRALTLWAEQVNAAGGLSGRPVALRLEDDRSEAGVARQRYEALAPDADLWVAPYGSWLTGAVLGVVEGSARPCIAPSAGDRSLWDGSAQWTAGLLNPSDTMLHSFVDGAAGAGVRTAAFVYRDDDFSRLVVRGAMQRARSRGLRIVADTPFATTRQARAGVRALRGDSAPDLFVGMGFQPQGAENPFLADALTLLESLREGGIEPFLACLGIGAAGADFRRRAGSAADSILGSTGWRTYLPTPGNDAFIQAYEKRWGETPDIHAAQGYAVGQVLSRAWRRAAAGSAAPGAQAVRDALFTLRTETVFGRFAVSAAGLQTGKQNAVVQWQQGRPQVIWPERYATGRLFYRL